MRSSKTFLFCHNYNWQSNNLSSAGIQSHTVRRRQVNTTTILSDESRKKHSFNVSSIYCTRQISYDYIICQDNDQSIYIVLGNLLNSYNDRKNDKNIQVKEFSNTILILSINNVYKKINLTCTIENVYDGSKDFQGYSLTKTSLFGIIILTTCVAFTFTLCFGWFGVIYYRQFERRRMKNKVQQALANSVQKILDQTPILTFNSNNNNNNDFIDDDPMCAICLESFINNEKIRKLACLHYFHIACIDPWLLTNQSCPLCNRNILNDSIPTISASITSPNGEINNREPGSTNTPDIININPVYVSPNSN